jgi:hypothetical protein
MQTVRDWLQRLVGVSGCPGDVELRAVLASAHAGLGKFTFGCARIDSPALFDFTMVSGHLELRLNAQHSAFPLLASALQLTEHGAAEMQSDQDRERLRCSQAAIQLLLAAWAQHEYELSGVRLRRAEESRYDWGRLVRRILSTPR